MIREVTDSRSLNDRTVVAVNEVCVSGSIIQTEFRLADPSAAKSLLSLDGYERFDDTVSFVNEFARWE
jgi:hypothetical protein